MRRDSRWRVGLAPFATRRTAPGCCSFCRPAHLFAVDTTFSAVSRRISSPRAPGDECAERFHADEPARRARNSGPSRTAPAASIATRSRDRRRQHAVAIRLILHLEKLPARHAHHAGRDAFLRELFIRFDAWADFASGAMRITAGFPCGASASTYAPRATPLAGAYFVRSSVGRFCRVSTSAAGRLSAASRRARFRPLRSHRRAE